MHWFKKGIVTCIYKFWFTAHSVICTHITAVLPVFPSQLDGQIRLSSWANCKRKINTYQQRDSADIAIVERRLGVWLSRFCINHSHTATPAYSIVVRHKNSCKQEQHRWILYAVFDKRGTYVSDSQATNRWVLVNLLGSLNLQNQSKRFWKQSLKRSKYTNKLEENMHNKYQTTITTTNNYTVKHTEQQIAGAFM